MHTITIGNAKANVNIAETARELARGLMYIKSLPQDEGILFCYPKPKILSFWMKNTLIPLSIAFINGKGKIVAFRDMNPGSLDSVKSPFPCKWALEMNKGWFDNNNIKVGDTVDYCADKGSKIVIRVVR